MSNPFPLKKICAGFLALYALCAVLIYFIAGDAFHYENTASQTIDAAAVVGEITAQQEVRQSFTVDTDRLVAYQLKFATYGRKNQAALTLRILDAAGETLDTERLDASQLEDNAVCTVQLDSPIEGRKGETVQLVISSDAVSDADAVTVYYGNSINLGRGSVAQSYEEEEMVSIGDQRLDGILYLCQIGQTPLWFGSYYWLIAGGIFLLLVLYACVLLHKEKTGGKSASIGFLRSLEKYKFLIKQLVSRDFKTKYRRSVLGVFWSFLNPLLTMLVQYVVFSTLFRSSIANYPVYLLSGIVIFNFFNETTSVGLTSITSNAPLITKVYVPKYIYPLTRMLSSSINMAFSLIPLFLVTVCTGVFPAPSWLLLVFNLLCLMGFSLGVTYLLATMMVYFRDTQFLWSVVCMIWMYCTPIFYPESIIPAKLLPIYHLNPLYQLVKFARCALIDRVSPGPMSYLICLAVGVIPLMLGIWVFNRKEKDFVLYL